MQLERAGGQGGIAKLDTFLTTRPYLDAAAFNKL
jgi:hypothetical protein